jgi:hypothetical protein
MITVGPGISIGNGITFQAEVILDGLQLYLDAGNTSSYSGSGSAWNDLSGNSNDATLVNTPTFDPDNQGSFQFNDLDEYVDVNASLASETFSIAAWINTTATGINMIFSKEGAAGTPWNYRMWLNGGSLIGDISTNLGGSRDDNSVTYAGSLNDGAWHLVMFTRNTDSMTLYVDGEQAATEANTLVDPISNAQELWIGRSAFTAGGTNPTGSYPYGGKIAQALVYNRVLNTTEARQTYYATQGRYA